MKNWTFLHLFVDEMGISHVNHHATHELNATHFAPPAPPMLVSETIDTQSFIIIELPVGWQGGWHPSPNNQWVICLSGKMGYQAEDGTEFFLDAGSCILTTDTNGNGHNSWNAGSTPIQLAVIQLPSPD